MGKPVVIVEYPVSAPLCKFTTRHFKLETPLSFIIINKKKSVEFVFAGKSEPKSILKLPAVLIKRKLAWPLSLATPIAFVIVLGFIFPISPLPPISPQNDLACATFATSSFPKIKNEINPSWIEVCLKEESLKEVEEPAVAALAYLLRNCFKNKFPKTEGAILSAVPVTLGAKEVCQAFGDGNHSITALADLL